MENISRMILFFQDFFEITQYHQVQTQIDWRSSLTWLGPPSQLTLDQHFGIYSIPWDRPREVKNDKFMRTFVRKKDVVIWFELDPQKLQFWRTTPRVSGYKRERDITEVRMYFNSDLSLTQLVGDIQSISQNLKAKINLKCRNVLRNPNLQTDSWDSWWRFASCMLDLDLKF